MRMKNSARFTPPIAQKRESRQQRKLHKFVLILYFGAGSAIPRCSLIGTA